MATVDTDRPTTPRSAWNLPTSWSSAARIQTGLGVGPERLLDLTGAGDQVPAVLVRQPCEQGVLGRSGDGGGPGLVGRGRRTARQRREEAADVVPERGPATRLDVSGTSTHR